MSESLPPPSGEPFYYITPEEGGASDIEAMWLAEDERADTRRYKIIRFRQHDDNEVIVRGLTLEQAQAHCSRDDTHGDGWFDGYAEDGPESETLDDEGGQS